MIDRFAPRRGNGLFEDVVQRTGLGPTMATVAVARACHRAGVDPEKIDVPGLERAMPFLTMTLRLLIPDQADARVRALNSLVREPQ